MSSIELVSTHYKVVLLRPEIRSVLHLLDRQRQDQIPSRDTIGDTTRLSELWCMPATPVYFQQRLSIIQGWGL